jgi:pantoate--beta-alanine ligase
MHIVRTVAELRGILGAHRNAQRSIGFVPTMGALHRGHATLVEKSVAECDVTVVSIFVNPLQFNNSADLETYPNTIDTDLELCARLGATAVFVPDRSEMYPDGFDTAVVPGDLATRFEGASRPGHFSGMCTVVLKLLLMVQPTHAFFGKKDYQQLAIVSRMATDLNLSTDIVGCETVRDEDGLALSSRNVRLSDEARRVALALPRALAATKEALLSGDTLDAASAAGSDLLASVPTVEISYFEVVDATTLTPVGKVFDETRLVALGAVVVDGVRLIDNVEIDLTQGNRG